MDYVRRRVGDVAASTKNALVGGPFGSNLVSSDYKSDGVPVIRGQNMGHGRWVSGEFAFVSSEKAAPFLRISRGQVISCSRNEGLWGKLRSCPRAKMGSMSCRRVR